MTTVDNFTQIVSLTGETMVPTMVSSGTPIYSAQGIVA